MRHVLRTLRTQWLGALGLLVGVTGAALGATGQPALLGKLNQASRPTVIQNTGNGPAATFQTSAAKPPFTVTSSRKVPNLNAAKLGGKRPSAFAAAGSSYTKAQTDATYAAKSAIYTKAEADAKYALAADTYTKTAADAAFAPASGSAAYQAAGEIQVGTSFNGGFSLGAGGGNTQVTTLPGFKAPVAGTLTVAALGNGVFVAPANLTLLVGASSADYNASLDGEFTVTVSVHLNANGIVTAFLYAENPSAQPMNLSAAMLVATFVPD